MDNMPACIQTVHVDEIRTFSWKSPPPKKKYNNTIKKTNKIKKTRIRLKKSIEIDTKKKRFSKYCGTMKKGLQCSPKT